MLASYKDLISTALVGGAAALAWANITEAGWPATSSTRLIALAVLVLGVAACAIGAAESWLPDKAERPWHQRLGSLGSAAAAIAAFVAVATGSTAALLIEASLVVALWLFATLRHLTTRAPQAVTAA